MSAEIIARTSAAPLTFTEDQSQMIRDAYANGATDGEFAVLMEIAKARRLNPLLKQVHFVKRWDKDKARMVWATQVSIDGLRAIAERTGLYAGQDEPEFIENPDGSLKLCKVRVWRKDWPRPAVGIAHWDEYVQTTKDKQTGKVRPNEMWARMRHVMLAKCAEALALRKAFPEDMSGLYTGDEMGQAENVEVQQHAPYLAPGTPPAAALPAPPTWADDLARCATLRDVRACYTAAASTDRDNRAQADDVRAWLAEHSVIATAAEVTALLATLPDDALVILDDIHADEEHPVPVRIERVARRVARTRSTWDAHSADVASKIVARSYAHATGTDLKAAGAALKRAIESGDDTDPTPPTGTDGPAREPGSDDGDDGSAAAYEAYRAAQGERAQVTELRVVRDHTDEELVTSEAAWAAYLATCNAFRTRHAFRNLTGAFVAEGVFVRREKAALARIEALGFRDPRGWLYAPPENQKKRRNEAA